MANDSNIVVKLRLLGRAAFRADATGAAKDLDALERAGGRVNRALSKLGTASLAVSTGIGVAAAAAARLGAQTNATQDSQMVAFRTMLRSRAAAQRLIRQIQQLAIDSPILDPATTGDAVRMLLAYGINAKRVLPLVRSLGDMSAASGKSIVEVMPRAALALGQIEGKGKLQAQEMNQLAESVGLSRKSIRRELGLTAKEFEATFTPGNNIKASRALPAIERAMRRQARGAADMLAKTTSGQVSRGRELMAIAAGDFTRPFYDEIGRLIGSTSDRLSKWQQSGGIKKFSRGLATGKGDGAGAKINRVASSIASGAIGAGREVIDALKPAVPFLQNILLPVVMGIAKGVGGGVVGAFKAVLFVVKPVMKLLGWLGEKTGPKLRGVFETVGKVIGFVFGGAILKVLGFIPKLGFAAKILMVPLRALDGVVRTVGRALGFVGKAIGALSSPFRGAFARAMQWVADKLGSVAKKIDGVVRRIRSVAIALGLLDDKKPPAEDRSTTPDPAPRGNTPRNRADTKRQRDKQKQTQEQVFGPSSPLFPPPAPARRQEAGDTIVNFNVDGKTFHRVVVAGERKARRGE